MALNPKTRLKDLDIKQGQEFLQRGLESFQLGEYDRAEELWSEARRNDWLSVAVWNNLAVCRMKRQSWEEANDHLKKALKLDFSNAVVRCNLAFCRFKLGKMEDAERYATEAVAMRPDLVAGRIVLSNVFFQKGLHELALAQAAEAIFWHPNSRGARWQHLRLLRKLGYEHEATRQESLLEALQYRVPFSDFLIDEMTDPPWGRIRRDESPSGNDDDDSDPDDTGSGVPRNPTPPRSGAGEKISNANYRAGMVRE